MVTECTRVVALSWQAAQRVAACTRGRHGNCICMTPDEELIVTIPPDQVKNTLNTALESTITVGFKNRLDGDHTITFTRSLTQNFGLLTRKVTKQITRAVVDSNGGVSVYGITN
jgi:hypothetical protein